MAGATACWRWPRATEVTAVRSVCFYDDFSASFFCYLFIEKLTHPYRGRALLAVAVMPGALWAMRIFMRFRVFATVRSAGLVVWWCGDNA